MKGNAKSIGKGISAVLIYATAGAAEGQVLDGLLGGRSSLASAILIHGCVVVSLFGWLSLLHRRGEDKRVAALFLVSTAGLGPIGFVGAALSVLVWRLASRASAAKLAAYYADRLGAGQNDPAKELYKNLMLGRDKPGRYASAAAVIDVLRWGTLEEQYKALAGLARNFRPEFANSIRFALESPEPTVRIQAATIAAKIEKEFTQQWLALRHELERSPDDSALCLELASHLDRYAHTGMLDEQREQDIRQQSVRLFQDYLARHPDSKDARLALGRLLTKLGEYEDAVACLATVLDDPAARPWYCQALYGLRRFDEIRELAYGDDGAANGPDKDSVASVLQVWSRVALDAPLLAGPTRAS